MGIDTIIGGITIHVIMNIIPHRNFSSMPSIPNAFSIRLVTRPHSVRYAIRYNRKCFFSMYDPFCFIVFSTPYRHDEDMTLAMKYSSMIIIMTIYTFMPFRLFLAVTAISLLQSMPSKASCTLGFKSVASSCIISDSFVSVLISITSFQIS